LSKLAREAAKQCGRTAFPQCEGPEDFERALADPSPCRLLLDPSGEEFPVPIAAEPSAIGVGPEGGFSPAELARARAAGWRITRLPASTLRTETAALAALTLLRHSFDTARRGAQNIGVRKS
jgi:16S rRNA (uracil1498-N3)-methyltransferase